MGLAPWTLKIKLLFNRKNILSWCVREYLLGANRGAELRLNPRHNRALFCAKKTVAFGFLEMCRPSSQASRHSYADRESEAAPKRYAVQAYSQTVYD